MAVTGCSDDSGMPSANPGASAVVDGRYCGFFSTDLVEEVLGTKELKVSGDTLSASDNPQACTIDVVDSSERLILTVNLTDDAPRPTSNVPAPGCTKAAVPTGWGTAFSCWSNDVMTTTAWPAKRRSIRVIQQSDATGKAAATSAAPRLLADLNQAVDSLG